MRNTNLEQTSAVALGRLQAALERDRTRKAELQREVERLAVRTLEYERRTTAIHIATTTLTHWVAPVDQERWRSHLVEWRKVLLDELLALPEKQRTTHESGTFRNLTISIALVDGVGGTDETGYTLETLRLGELMRVAGYEQVGADPVRNFDGSLPWFGSLPEVERRITKAMKERDDAQAQLDAALGNDIPNEVVVDATTDPITS